MVLVEADPRRERKIRAHAYEHVAPSFVVDVEIVLNDPALGELQMPAIAGLVADGDHDACWLARLQHDHDRVGFGALEIGLDERVATPFRRIQYRNVSLRRP